MNPYFHSLILRWQDGVTELGDLLAPVSPVARRVDACVVRPAGVTGLLLALSYRFGLAWESCVIVADLVAALLVLAVGVIVVPEMWRAAWNAKPLPGRHRVQTRVDRVRARTRHAAANLVAAVWLSWNATVPLGGEA